MKCVNQDFAYNKKGAYCTNKGYFLFYNKLQQHITNQNLILFFRSSYFCSGG